MSDYMTFSGAGQAYEQQVQDAMLVAQARLAALYAQQQADLEAQQQADLEAQLPTPVPDTPVGIPATVAQAPVVQPQAQAPQKPTSVWDKLQGTRFNTEYLQRNNESLIDFAALPWSERERKVDAYLADRAKQEGWTDAQKADMKARSVAIIYADNSRPAGVGNNDIIDKPLHTLVGLGGNTLGEIVATVSPSTGESIRNATSSAQDWIGASFNDATRDNARKAAFDAAKLQRDIVAGNVTPASEAGISAANVLKRVFNHPSTIPSELASSAVSVLPIIAAKVLGGNAAATATGAVLGATDVRSSIRDSVMGADFSKYPEYTQLVQALGDDHKARMRIADELVNSPTAYAFAGTGGLVGALGGSVSAQAGIASMFGKGATNQFGQGIIRRALRGIQHTAVEGALEVPQEVTNTIAGNVLASNVDPSIPTLAGVPSAVGRAVVEGALAAGPLSALSATVRGTPNTAQANPVPPPTPTEPSAPIPQPVVVEPSAPIPQPVVGVPIGSSPLVDVPLPPTVLVDTPTIVRDAPAPQMEGAQQVESITPRSNADTLRQLVAERANTAAGSPERAALNDAILNATASGSANGRRTRGRSLSRDTQPDTLPNTPLTPSSDDAPIVPPTTPPVTVDTPSSRGAPEDIRRAAIAAFTDMVGNTAEATSTQPDAPAQSASVFADLMQHASTQQDRTNGPYADAAVYPDTPDTPSVPSAEGTGYTPVVDFMTARYGNDPSDVQRGSAYLVDAAEDTWQVRFFDSKGEQHDTRVNSSKDAEALLTSYTTTDKEGRVYPSVLVDKGTGTMYGANYTRVMGMADGLTPSRRKFYNVLTAVGVPPQRAFSIANAMQRTSAATISSSGSLAAIGDPLLAGRVVQTRAKGVASTTSAGLVDVGFARHADILLERLNGIRKKGVPDNLIDAFMYASSAAERNAVGKDMYPVNAQGEEQSIDMARFEYYVDGVGMLHTTPGTGRRLVHGVDAPAQFIKDFMYAYSHVVTDADMNGALSGLSDGNTYVLQTLLDQGAIDTKQFAKLAKTPLYLPMREADHGSRAFTPTPLGRRSAAVSPINQWRDVMNSRIKFAYMMGAIREVGRALMIRPNPGVAKLNSEAVQARQFPDIDSDGVAVNPEVLIKSMGDGKSVVYYEGEIPMRITPMNASIATALSPNAHNSPAAFNTMLAIGTASRMYATALVGVPAFWLKTATWDVLMTTAMMQGVAKSVGENMSAWQAYKASAKVYRSAVSAIGDSVKTVISEATNRTVNLPDPMRMLYNEYAGGVRYSARDGVMDMISSTKHGSTLQRAAGRTLQGFSLLQSPGHIIQDAIRFATFKGFMERANGGVFRDPLQLRTFVAGNQEAVQRAAIASKAMLNNYEDTGASMLLRSSVPFYTAATSGFKYGLGMTLTTNAGRGVLGALTAAAYLAAMTAMGDDDDEASDGGSRYLRNHASWSSLKIGDTLIPIPPELRPAIAVANLVAAQEMAHDPNINGLMDSTITTMLSVAPIVPAATGLAEGRSAMSDFGLLGVLVQMGASSQDMHGRSVVSASAKSADNRLDPYFKHPRPSDTPASIWLSEWVFNTMKYNIPPGKLDMLVKGVGGQWAQLSRDVELGQVDGRGTDGAVIDWLLKAYKLPKDNNFDAVQAWARAGNRLVGSEDSAAVVEYTAADDAVNATQSTLGYGELNRTRTSALKSGDAALWRDTNALIGVADDATNQLRKGYYKQQQARDLLTP